MRIKSLLLGSAAASMVAVSGAQAADAIVTYVEPEPVEYVRVCDVYGAGFFYIPGTETCLRISGYARYELGAITDRFGPRYPGFTPGAWNKTAQGRINFDARSETEWGTLRGYVRAQGNAPGAPSLTWVFVSLGTQQGELLAGHLESAWAWGGPIGNYGMHSDTGGVYGFQRRNQIRYTFSAPEGFFGVVSAEDNGARYMPDVVGKAGVSQAWGGVYGAAAYDAVDRSWAARVGAEVNIPNAPGSSVLGKFFWSNSATNAYTPNLSTFNTPLGLTATPTSAAAPIAITGTGARWSAMASFQHQLTPEFAAGAGYQYIRHFDGINVGGFTVDGARTHIADATLIWTPVGPDLEIRLQGAYAKTRARFAGDNVSGDNWSGFLRFQRNF